MKKLASVILLIAIIASVLVSCSGASEKTFTSEGLTITLTSSFKEASGTGYTVAFDSKDVAVFALKEPFSALAGLENYTLAEYTEIVRQNNSDKDNLTAIKTADALTWFEYTFNNTEVNKTYHYISYTFKANDAFWLVQFATVDSDIEALRPNIVTWAKSVSFG